MASIASLGRAVSGLQASQRGLQVTGHNLSNINTEGYTRQQLLQHDSMYVSVGAGSGLKQVGLGVSLTEIRQVRDAFVDKRLRTETSVLNFYNAKSEAMREIETILDEPYGETLSGIMEDFWKQTQKLSTNPSGVEERLAFIQTADVLIKRASQIFDGLETYQGHLNTQVKESVGRINEITAQIKTYNDAIAKAEINGDNANDYRDQRNLLLDELAEYLPITYSEDATGRVTVKGNGYELVSGQFVTEIGLKYMDNGSGFVMPTWGENGVPLFSLNQQMNATMGGDSGKLLGLLVARGEQPADEHTSWEEIAINGNKSVDANGNSYLIPKVQKQLAELINKVAEIVNDTLVGKGIDGEAGVPVFVPTEGIRGNKLTTEQIKNWWQTSDEEIAVLTENLHKPMVGKEGEGALAYEEMLVAHDEMLEAYQTYLNTPDTDPGYAAAQAAYRDQIDAYKTKREAYETEIEGIKVVEDEALLKSYNVQQAKAEDHVRKLFQADNMQVNPVLLKDGGYNHLGTVGEDVDNLGDNSLITDLLSKWSEPIDWGDIAGTDVNAPNYKKVSVMDFYSEMVSKIGAEGYEYAGKVSEKNTIVTSTQNERLAMSGVSQDEELGNMLKYQYAYNASARMVSMLDGMMDTIINRM